MKFSNMFAADMETVQLQLPPWALLLLLYKCSLNSWWIESDDISRTVHTIWYHCFRWPLSLYSAISRISPPPLQSSKPAATWINWHSFALCLPMFWCQLELFSTFGTEACVIRNLDGYDSTHDDNDDDVESTDFISLCVCSGKSHSLIFFPQRSIIWIEEENCCCCLQRSRTLCCKCSKGGRERGRKKAHRSSTDIDFSLLMHLMNKLLWVSTMLMGDEWAHRLILGPRGLARGGPSRPEYGRGVYTHTVWGLQKRVKRQWSRRFSIKLHLSTNMRGIKLQQAFAKPSSCGQDSLPCSG